MARKNYKLDPEEQEILDTFNRGEWVSKGEIWINIRMLQSKLLQKATGSISE